MWHHEQLFEARIPGPLFFKEKVGHGEVGREVEVSRSPFDGRGEDDPADAVNDVAFLLLLPQLTEERSAVFANVGDVEEDGGEKGFEVFGCDDGRIGGSQRFDEALREETRSQLVAIRPDAAKRESSALSR